MRIILGSCTLEHIRDALDAVVEDTDDARALRGVRWHSLDIGGDPSNPQSVAHRPELRLFDKDRLENARWDAHEGHWERSYVCDYCGREEWSEHPENECNCRPAYADGEWQGLER